MQRAWLKVLGSASKRIRNDWTEWENGLLLQKVMFARRPGVRRGDRILYYGAGWRLIFAAGEVTSGPYREESDRHRGYPWWVNVHLDLLRTFVKDGIPVTTISVGGRELSKSIQQKGLIRLRPEEYEAARRALEG